MMEGFTEVTGRVVAQGDRRPMADHPAAMEELRSILATREPIYDDAAITVRTSGVPPEKICAAIERQLVGFRETLD